MKTKNSNVFISTIKYYDQIYIYIRQKKYIYTTKYFNGFIDEIFSELHSTSCVTIITFMGTNESPLILH